MSLLKSVLFITLITSGISALADESVLMMSNFRNPSRRPVAGALSSVVVGRDGTVTANFNKGESNQSDSSVIAQISPERVKSIADSFDGLTPVVRDPTKLPPPRCLACNVHELIVYKSDGTNIDLANMSNADRLKSILNGFESLARDK